MYSDKSNKLTFFQNVSATFHARVPDFLILPAIGIKRIVDEKVIHLRNRGWMALNWPKEKLDLKLKEITKIDKTMFDLLFGAYEKTRLSKMIDPEPTPTDKLKLLITEIAESDKTKEDKTQLIALEICQYLNGHHECGFCCFLAANIESLVSRSRLLNINSQKKNESAVELVKRDQSSPPKSKDDSSQEISPNNENESKTTFKRF